MINKHKSNKIKENSNTVRQLNNGTDHRHSKSCCDQSSPARRTIKASAFRAPEVGGLSEWRSLYIWQQASNTSLWQTTSQWHSKATHASGYNLVIPEQATKYHRKSTVRRMKHCWPCQYEMSYRYMHFFGTGPQCTQWIVLSKNTTKDMLCSILHFMANLHFCIC